MEAAGLSDRVTVVERDYRELDGTLHQDRVDRDARGDRRDSSRPFFDACDRLLAPGGRACIQTILVPDERFPRYRTNEDWIERYVFPGCLIPSSRASTSA